MPTAARSFKSSPFALWRAGARCPCPDPGWVSKPLVLQCFGHKTPLVLQNWRPTFSRLQSGGHFETRFAPNASFKGVSCTPFSWASGGLQTPVFVVSGHKNGLLSAELGLPMLRMRVWSPFLSKMAFFPVRGSKNDRPLGPCWLQTPCFEAFRGKMALILQNWRPWVPARSSDAGERGSASPPSPLLLPSPPWSGLGTLAWVLGVIPLPAGAFSAIGGNGPAQATLLAPVLSRHLCAALPSSLC